MRRQIAAFLALAAISTAAAADRGLPSMSISCAAEAERVARICPVGGDQRSFMACKARNGSAVSDDCKDQARARLQAMRQVCRSGPVSASYQSICAALQ